MLRIRRRLAMWALIFIGLPLLARGLEWAAETIERQWGPLPSARRLRRAGWVANGLQASLSPRRGHKRNAPSG
jgi:hypothetical protein